jgi:hypothetical protein
MSLMSIFSKTLPKINQLEFDAKLEGITSKSVYLTQFPVEFGANMNDHAILLPNRYLLTGAVSNTPLGLDLNDIGMMGVGAVATAVGGVAGAAISGVSAYLLSGSDATRAKTAWEALSKLLESRARFTLSTGLEDMENMVLLRLDQRTRPEDEEGLIFIAELQQTRIIGTKETVNRNVGKGVTSADQLMKNDTVTTQGAPMVATGDASVEVIP